MLTGQARDVLRQAEAAARAARVNHADYRLDLELTAGLATYRGEATLSFAMTGEGPLFLDFRGRTIEQLEVNGHTAEPDWTGYRLTLPGELLREENVVRVRYLNDYDTTGDGFHRFVDPEDDAEYVYTNFEPYEAHRLFPCFDQPDIKGHYTVTVVAPARMAGRRQRPARASRRRPTKAARAISSPRPNVSVRTSMALIGGPYAVRRDRAQGPQPGTVRAPIDGAPARRPGGRNLRVDEPGTRLLRGAVRPALPVCQVRPGVRARIQLGRHGKRRLRDLQRGAPVPRPADRQRAPQSRRNIPARAGAHVVRQPGDHALVERPVAEREFRDVRLVRDDGRGNALQQCVEGLRRRHQALGVPAGPAAHHAPDLRPGGSTPRSPS